MLKKVTGLDLTSDEGRQALKNGFTRVFDADPPKTKLRAMRDYWQRKRPSAMPLKNGLIEFENYL
ncbi:MAG: hypothetical protein SVE93_06775 [Candidatus Thermoplasmatota archaeon]|nr:hypothetical protein [Candidatus Thermoplasmatota archaeon]